MAHFPVNHRLRPLYRIITALAGTYILTFGIVGVTQTSGTALFTQTGLPRALGLRTNLAFAILSVAAGAILIGGAIIGRNIDVYINIVAGIAFMTAGTLMLTLIPTNGNVLGFSVATCIVSDVLGILLLASGLYGKIASAT
ncbi:DUF4383 domain-containing protein [Rugosimonospora africana]|uniref:DUF4383 domain-containing protein n=1 Tax=Rugosimonospora africana TaxID=556532 RepID=A0A8J3R3Z7_9ACTN|nr:DUF4383 domain-containing protein [Rugosimonospora africana]GIH21457.1 hypothetical protein Raf01_96290 [Rugosimonospora africana]